MYSCKIVADSLNPQNDRLTTFILTYPRIIHSEMMTHRMFSRNSASSRAIPFNKMVKMVEENPFIPIAWQKDHKGMQGAEYFTSGQQYNDLLDGWLEAKNQAVFWAKDLNITGATKQLCNRLLEPFMWHTVIITASDFENFFKLRCPEYTHVTQKLTGISTTIFRSKKDYEHCYGKQSFTDLEWLSINKSQADIHIQAIAELMWDEYKTSIPLELQSGEWHIPDLGHEWNEEELRNLFYTKYNNIDPSYEKHVFEKVKIATAHCAKISYDNFGTKVDYEKDISLHDSLLESGHMSPFEHCARVMSNKEYPNFIRGEICVSYNGGINEEILECVKSGGEGWCNNFKGFIQYRYLVENNIK
jgi:hypothetical protein